MDKIREPGNGCGQFEIQATVEYQVQCFLTQAEVNEEGKEDVF